MKSCHPMKPRTISILFLFFAFFLTASGQESENSLRKSTILDGNRVRTLYFNYGSIGKPNWEPSFEWPAGSGQTYAYEFGILVGASVVSDQGERLHIVDDGMLWGGVTATCESVDPNFTSNWQPVTGFAAADSGGSVARSDDPSTWPESWDAWPGLFGSGSVMADLESYYVMDDRFICSFMEDYLPVADEPGRGGAGIAVAVRSYQWSEEDYADVLLLNIEISNIGDNAIDSVIFAMKGDPHIGGASDYREDWLDAFDWQGRAALSQEERPDVSDLIYAWDGDAYGDPHFNGRDPGFLGFDVLDQTFRLGNVTVLPWWSSSWDSDNFWDMYTNTGWSGTDFQNAMDNMLMFSLQPFPLEAGGSVEVPLAIVFGSTREDMLENSTDFETFYRTVFHPDYIPPSVSLNSPQEDFQVQNMLEISWELTSGSQPLDSLQLFYCNSADQSWQRIATLAPQSLSYGFDMTGLNSGFNYRIALKAFDARYSNFVMSDYFSLQNAHASDPEFLLLNPIHEQTFSGSKLFEYRANPGNGNGETLLFMYSRDGSENWEPLFDDLALDHQEFLFDSRMIPNTERVRLAFAFLNDPFAEIVYISNQFTVTNSYPQLEQDDITTLSGIRDAEISIDIVDYTAITGDTYEITFQDSFLMNVRYSVQNLNSGEILVDLEPLPDESEQSPTLEGLRFSFQDQDLVVSDSLSGLFGNVSNFSIQIAPHPLGTRGYPFDYELVFFDSVADTSVIAPFRVINCVASNLTDSTPVSLVRTGPGPESGAMEDGQALFIVHDDPVGSGENWTGNWRIRFDEPDSGEGVPPRLGDTVRVITHKPFSHRDTLRFNTAAYVGVAERVFNPSNFELHQNYPNPFNPVTQIRYQLEESAFIGLNVYDIRGRLVRTLIQTDHPSGSYTITWDGNNNSGIAVSAGIYFCQFRSTGNDGSVVQRTIKMTLLK